MIKTPEGRVRKDRETLCRDVEFDKVIAEEDVRQQREQTQQQPARSSTDPAPVLALAVDPEDEVAGTLLVENEATSPAASDNGAARCLLQELLERRRAGDRSGLVKLGRTVRACIES